MRCGTNAVGRGRRVGICREEQEDEKDEEKEEHQHGRAKCFLRSGSFAKCVAGHGGKKSEGEEAEEEEDSVDDGNCCCCCCCGGGGGAGVVIRVNALHSTASSSWAFLSSFPNRTYSNQKIRKLDRLSKAPSQSTCGFEREADSAIVGIMIIMIMIIVIYNNITTTIVVAS